MKLSKLSIRNTLGIEHIEITPGKVTVISGKNGAGKSSVLKAIQSIFERGQDLTLKQVGAERSETILTLVDGDETHEVRRLITDKTYRTTVDGKADKSWLTAISQAARLNPVAFIQAKPAERVALLIKAFGLEKPLAAIQAATSLPSAWAAAADSPDALTAIAAARKVVYEARHKVGGSLREAKTLAESLAGATVDRTAGEIMVELDRLNDELDTMRREARVKQDAIKNERAEAEKNVRAWRDEEIEAAKAEYDAAVDAARTEYDRTCQTAERALFAANDALRAELEPKADAVKAEIARLSALKDEAIRGAEAARLRDEATARAATLAEEHGKLEASVIAIDAIHEQLTATLPIKNLVVQDGEIIVNGVPFPVLNSQRQIDVAVKIAERIPSDLDICLIDGFEAFDPEQKAAFLERAEKSPLQFLIAEVSAEGLEVTTR